MHAVGSVAGRSGAHPFQRGAVTAWRDDGEACVGPQRNQLVWIDTQGWKALRDREWDTEAGSLLAHWCEQQLPLVVACDHGQTPAGHLRVGLPAPLRWSRRRLALEVARERVRMTGHFPALTDTASVLCWDRSAHELAERLSAVGTITRVYGSFGWQVLSGEACARDESDIDLLLEVCDAATARAALPLLLQAQLHRRIDGEFVFPGGEAVAWREFERADAGQARHVLLKSRAGVRLVSFVDCREFTQGA